VQPCQLSIYDFDEHDLIKVKGSICSDCAYVSDRAAIDDRTVLSRKHHKNFERD